jgi:hypothetical protein
MHSITTSAHTLSVDIPPNGKTVREVFVDEDLEISASPAITAITLVDQPGGTPATINGGTICCHEIGKHLFTVTFSDGKAMHLHVMSMDRACLDRVPQFPSHIIINPTANPKPVGRTLTERILTLRSLCNHAPGFDGTPASFDKIGSLANYGA